jgi:CDP-diacylglycerol--glycerol-3-phosphate 3-phosphatidyltransferase
MDTTKAKARLSLTDWLRRNSKWFLEPLGRFVGKLGIHPNYITLAGLIGNVLGAAALAWGHVTLGGIIILLMGPVDALDGATARASGEKSPFGAFGDSVTDRYSEAVIYFGLLIYYLRQPESFTPSILIFLAFVGSVMVSYAKARAEALGFDSNVGWLTRVERYLILAPCLIFNIPLVALWLIAILANFTALQRIVHVRRQWYDKNK